MLTVNRLCKSFAGVRALNQIDLHVPSNAVLGVIGMNGSGKTTLLNCINGIYTPDAGTIHLDGRDITRLPVHRVAQAGIGRTFQVPRIFSQLTLLDNLEVAQPHNSKEARYRQSEYWLCKVKLMELRHNFGEELSGGQQKLLELARIMVAQPKLILLDEPFAGVNPQLALLMIDVIRDIASQHGCAVVLVSHDLTSIYRLSSHIIVMNDGAILTQGSAAQVRADPAVIEVYLGA